MGIVLGIILVFYYLSRKGLNLLPAGKAGAIKVVEMRYLMPKKALCLVNVRGRELLLGIGTERIELIAELDLPPTSAPGRSFETNLHASLAAADQTTTASSSLRPAP
ncbi:MAG: hypothetical protein A2521_11230 [Deltaproteobacteria bacterium RIFOXYD12_FULL_57_12]|nr:MAG: hypothetical protein A2521_11230 [Deltaproteobacteria bacterium RIFOXYD12_FULL_57_12]